MGARALGRWAPRAAAQSSAAAPGGAGAGDAHEPALRDHVVLLGYGRVGAEVARWLDAHGVPYLAVDADPLRVRALRGRGVPALAGDAGGPMLLAHAGLPASHRPSRQPK